MTIDILLADFDRLAEAPNGIPKLRELILQLAVRGKLVPQDSNDEPASELLKKIQAEQQRLVQEEKIRKPRPLPPIEPEAFPYQLPSSWEWVRIRQITHDCGQKIPDTIFSYIDVSTIDARAGSISEYPAVVQPEDAPSRARKLVQLGTVIYSTVRPYLLNVAVVDRHFDPPPIVSTAFAVLHPYAGIDSRFLFHYLRSEPFVEYVNEAMTGMAYPAINDSKMSRGPIPLPPLAEQKRIVAKVDELMALCDELEAKQQAKRTKQVALNQASLHALTQPNGTNLGTAWHRIRDHFDDLYTVPETVTELRQTILQLAVIGRLVPQDPNNEPASELLKKIQAEKQRLIAEGKIRKRKPLPPIEPDELPYELPRSWTWARVDDVILSSEAGWSPQCEKHPRSGTMEWGVLKVSSVTWGKFDPKENKALPRSLEPRHGLEVKQHDFLLSRANTVDLVARSVVVEESQQRLILSDKIIRLQTLVLPLKRFFNLYNNGPYARAYYRKNASGTSSSMRNVSRSCIHALPVPIPPLAEQKRIVAKVDQLMSLCDDLETKLTQTQQDANKLLSAIVHVLTAEEMKGTPIS